MKQTAFILSFLMLAMNSFADTQFTCNSMDGLNTFTIEKEPVNGGQSSQLLGYLNNSVILYCAPSKKMGAKYHCTGSELVGNASISVAVALVGNGMLVTKVSASHEKDKRDLVSFACQK